MTRIYQLVDIQKVVKRQEEKEKIYDSEWTESMITGASVAKRIKIWTVEEKENANKKFVEVYHEDSFDDIKEIVENEDPDRKYTTYSRMRGGKSGFYNSTAGERIKYKIQYVPIVEVSSSSGEYSREFAVTSDIGDSSETELANRLGQECLVSDGEYLSFADQDPSELRRSKMKKVYPVIMILSTILFAVAASLYPLTLITLSYVVFSTIASYIMLGYLPKRSLVSDHELSDGETVQNLQESIVKEYSIEDDSDKTHPDADNSTIKADVEVGEISADKEGNIVLEIDGKRWTFQSEKDNSISDEIKHYIVDNKERVTKGKIVLVVADPEQDSELSEEWFMSDDGRMAMMFPNSDTSVPLDVSDEIEESKELEFESA